MLYLVLFIEKPMRPVRKEEKPKYYQIPHHRPKEAYYWRRKNRPPCPREDLSAENYRAQFYRMLWYEEKEHMRKLKVK